MSSQEHAQGNRVTFQDQQLDNNGDFGDMSDGHAGEEEVHDIVHDLHRDVPASAGLNYGEGLEKGILTSSGKRSNESGSGLQVIETVNQMSADDNVVSGTMNASRYEVRMEVSLNDFSRHVTDCNRDFKENIMRKVQTIKLADTAELNKKVEELKSQEALELAELNKQYQEQDQRFKKLEKKVSWLLV